MLSGPVSTGSIVGVVIILLTLLLNKKSAVLAKIPSYLGLLASIIIFIISFEIRGFEGAAYGICAFTILIFTILSFYISIKISKVKKH
ncbi:YesK family protein [Siminovitchia fortis]|uniref:YesK family protein n=1 Tax=Siminovitchia fortis TaxID=254758 RepID=UPI0013E3D135|nr:YesK family protein [Siminovitchia fortis]WHY81201.1 YesK family protein [Siminovitchia fortis]